MISDAASLGIADRVERIGRATGEALSRSIAWPRALKHAHLCRTAGETAIGCFADHRDITVKPLRATRVAVSYTSDQAFICFALAVSSAGSRSIDDLEACSLNTHAAAFAIGIGHTRLATVPVNGTQEVTRARMVSNRAHDLVSRKTNTPTRIILSWHADCA